MSWRKSINQVQELKHWFLTCSERERDSEDDF